MARALLGFSNCVSREKRRHHRLQPIHIHTHIKNHLRAVSVILKAGSGLTMRSGTAVPVLDDAARAEQGGGDGGGHHSRRSGRGHAAGCWWGVVEAPQSRQ